MRISLIAALSRNGVIGTDTGLPWHLPRDLKRFRSLTRGKPIILGRKTLDHIGRPLPERVNIVLSLQPFYAPEGVLVVHSVDEALSLARKEAERLNVDEVMVIGGGEVYRAFLPWADRLYLTVVEGDFAGTATFPIEELERIAWAVTHRESHAADAKNPYPLTFWQLDRTAGEGVTGAVSALLGVS